MVFPAASRVRASCWSTSYVHHLLVVARIEDHISVIDYAEPVAERESPRPVARLPTHLPRSPSHALRSLSGTRAAGRREVVGNAEDRDVGIDLQQVAGDRHLEKTVLGERFAVRHSKWPLVEVLLGNRPGPALAHAVPLAFSRRQNQPSRACQSQPWRT